MFRPHSIKRFSLVNSLSLLLSLSFLSYGIAANAWDGINSSLSSPDASQFIEAGSTIITPQIEQQLYELTQRADKALSPTQLGYPYTQQAPENALSLYKQGKMIYTSKQPHPLLLYLEGVAALINGQVEEAQGALLEALYYSPNFRRAQQLLIETYIDLGQLQQAQSLLPGLMDLPGNQDSNVNYLTAHLLYKKGQLQEANSYFEQLFAISQPSDFLAAKREKILTMMADSYRQLGEMEKALPLYQQLTQQTQAPANIWADFGEVLKATHNDPQALDAYRKAFYMDPSSITPLVNQARNYLWSNQLEDAFLAYETLARVAPTRQEFSNLLVDIAYKAQQDGRLSETANALLEDNINSINPLQGAASSEYAMMKYCDDANECAAIKQGLYEQLNQGDLLNQLKAALLLQAPVEALKRADQIDNSVFDNPETLASLVLLGGGPLVYSKATNNPNFVEAKNFITPSVQVSLKQTQSAFGLIQAKQYQEALALSRQALNSNLFNGETYLASAIAQYQLGEKDVAKQAYQTAKTMGFNGQWVQVFPKQLAKLDPSLVEKKK